MEFKDYYQTLGLKKSATDKELKQAYRKLARKFHPDVNPNDASAETRFKEVTEAYEVLGDPDARRKYDELGANWRLYEQGQQTGRGPAAGWPFGGGWTVNVGGGRGPGNTEIFGEEDPFSDFFRTFFGGGPHSSEPPRTAHAPRNRRGRDVEQEIQLTLEEAFRGVTRRLSLKTRGHARTVDVRIPAGVGDGARVRVSGEGETGIGGAAAGDVYLRVQIARHSELQRKGQDLYVGVAVPVTTAVLGGTVSVETVDRRPLQLKIPAATQAGQVFRLKGQGMPSVRQPNHRGDLYATVNVQIPRDLTSEQRAHYEALAVLPAPDGARKPANRARTAGSTRR